MAERVEFEWMGNLARDLRVAEETAPFERVMRRYVEEIDALRARALTWTSIARILTRHAVLRRSGKPISGDQLRAVMHRIRAKNRARDVPPTTNAVTSTAKRQAEVASRPGVALARERGRAAVPARVEHGSLSVKDLSAGDISNAQKMLSSIRKEK